MYDVELINDRLEGNAPLTVFRTESNQTESFTKLVDVLRNWDNYCLIVDETSTIQNRQTVSEGLEYLMRQSPDNVDVIQSTHRIVDTQRLVRALATDTFIFRTTLNPDLDLIESEYGEEIRQAVSSLGLYQCVHYWIDIGGVPKYSIWNDPNKWYVSIGNRRS